MNLLAKLVVTALVGLVVNLAKESIDAAAEEFVARFDDMF